MLEELTYFGLIAMIDFCGNVFVQIRRYLGKKKNNFKKSSDEIAKKNLPAPLPPVLISHLQALVSMSPIYSLFLAA